MVVRVLLLLVVIAVCAGCGGGSGSLSGDAEVQGVVEDWLSGFVPVTPYTGCLMWPPPYGFPDCRFAHGPIEFRNLGGSHAEAEFDYSGTVTFSNVPEWQETASGRVVLNIQWVSGRWMSFNEFRIVRSSEVFGRPSDGTIPRMEIESLLINGSEQPDEFRSSSPLLIQFSVSGLGLEWWPDPYAEVYISAVDPAMPEFIRPDPPIRSDSAFSTSASAPYDEGRYRVAVSVTSIVSIDGFGLGTGSRASASQEFTVE